MTEHTDLTSPAAEMPSALLIDPASPAPEPCACPDVVLAAALDAVIGLAGAELEAVLAVAEVDRPGVRTALRAAFEAEAHRYAGLARQAFAAADRLAADPTVLA